LRTVFVDAMDLANRKAEPATSNGCGLFYFGAESPLQERQEVGVDRLGVRGGHAVREALVGLERAVPQSSDDSGQPWLNTMGCPLPQSL